MEFRWKKYYGEIFNTYHSEFFSKMWGNHTDEYGNKYENVFKNELILKKEDFSEYMYLFNKYGIKYNRKAIAMYIIHLFDGLKKCDYPERAYDIADMIINSIDKKSEFNNLLHPEIKSI